MKQYIGLHQAVNDTDFLELALGTPVELWLGEDGETPEERAARLDAARDILAEDPRMVERSTWLAVEAIGSTMPDLLRLAPAPAPAPVRRPRRVGVPA
jgi:hypothetical protein